MKNQHEIREWLQGELAMRLAVPVASIDPDENLDSYSLDSSEAVELTLALEGWLEIELDPALLWERQTVNEIVRAVTSVGEDPVR